jgi:hypothetical protein
MSGIDASDRSDAGQLFTRQGISLIGCYNPPESSGGRVGRFRQPPYVAARIGPSHPLPGRRKRAGVWSLRIPGTVSDRPGLSCWFSAPRTLSLLVTGPSWERGRDERVVEDPRVFQHIAGCAPHRHRCGGQLPLACVGDPYLRTLIVRAAVYWRLGSELRSRRI